MQNIMIICTTKDTIDFGLLLLFSSALLKDRFPLCNINPRNLTNDVKIMFYWLWGPSCCIFLMYERVMKLYGCVNLVNFKQFSWKSTCTNLVVFCSFYKTAVSFLKSPLMASLQSDAQKYIITDSDVLGLGIFFSPSSVQSSKNNVFLRSLVLLRFKTPQRHLLHGSEG